MYYNKVVLTIILVKIHFTRQKCHATKSFAYNKLSLITTYTQKKLSTILYENQIKFYFSFD